MFSCASIAIFFLTFSSRTDGSGPGGAGSLGLLKWPWTRASGRVVVLVQYGVVLVRHGHSELSGPRARVHAPPSMVHSPRSAVHALIVMDEVRLVHAHTGRISPTHHMRRVPPFPP